MKVHHSAICVRDVEMSLRFWRDGLGFEVLMDASFEGDWPTLFGVGSTSLRSLFLGDPADPTGGIVELVDFGTETAEAQPATVPASGFFLLSITTDVASTLSRLAKLGLGGTPRLATVMGVQMAVVTEPTGMRVELIDRPAPSGDSRA